MESPNFDSIIAGGGMVGLTLAIALADAGLSVAVVDRDALEQQAKADFDGRVSAVAYSSRRMLEALGLWEGIAVSAEPILDIRVTDGFSPFFLHYNHDEVGVERFGHIVENQVIRRTLHERVTRCATISMLAPMQIEGLRQDAYKATLVLSGGKEIHAPLLVGADGKNSQIRVLAGIPALERSYAQTAIVATIGHSLLHGGLALERFLPTGPFAVLPMQNNRSSLVWVEPALLAEHYLSLDDATFLAEIEKRVGSYLGELSLTSQRFSFPLGLMHAERYVQGRVTLIGDAAHAIHPVAGQGVNLGWRDAAVLAERIVDARRLGLDIGGQFVLEGYQRWRRFDNIAMLAVTDGLNRLFSNRSMALHLARGLGFEAVKNLPPVKRFFMRHAMGMVGDVPKLLQGKRI